MTAPFPAQKAPFRVKLEAGRSYFWCVCGLSAKQPFCDGSHQGSGLAPKKFTADKDGPAFLCGCKATDNAPLCDGSHKSLS